MGAIDEAGNVPSWSNRNPELTAPGVNILSTYKDDGYEVLSGTSMACPHVSATAALVQAARLANGLGPLDPESLRNLLRSTAEDLGSGGCDESYGYGLVRAYLAVKAALGN